MNEEVESSQPSESRPGEPCIMVIFGASGDLTTRKLIPALYNLQRNKLLSEEFVVIGVGRAPMSSEDFRQKIGRDLHQFATVAVEQESWEWMSSRLYYLAGDFHDASLYARLGEMMRKFDQERSTRGNGLFYLATAPNYFCSVVKQLGEAGLTREDEGNWRRVVIEKPFGHDLDSARSLNTELRGVIKENQIYRIDHYLGKETVQNIMAFRFSNGIFEPIWNRRYVDHVQVTVAESVGVEQRGGYYEEAGALRDMVPNHMMQLLALIAMEPPVSFSAEAVRDEKAKLLRAIQPLSPEDVLTHAVRGQYGEGTIEGKAVPAYRAEPKVAAHSTTETYAALKLQIDNWRWAEVPFYLRTGKRLAKRVTEIAIHFKRAPMLLFRRTPIEQLMRNILLIRIQPDEGILLRFGAKIPGPAMRLGAVDMNFNYADYFGSAPSTGYETLLRDAMIGDPTLFQRDDTIEAGWGVVTPLLDVWKALPPRVFPNYKAGSWGPKEADELLQRDGRHWRVAD